MSSNQELNEEQKEAHRNQEKAHSAREGKGPPGVDTILEVLPRDLRTKPGKNNADKGAKKGINVLKFSLYLGVFARDLSEISANDVAD